MFHVFRIDPELSIQHTKGHQESQCHIRPGAFRKLDNLNQRPDTTWRREEMYSSKHKPMVISQSLRLISLANVMS